MGNEKVIPHSTKGSSFVRIANLDFHGNLEKVLLVHNTGHWVQEDGKDLFYKDTDYSLPGGKHRVYSEETLKGLGLPIDCCETPEETALREGFEEANIILKTEDPYIAQSLIGLASEIKRRKQEKEETYLRMAGEGYVKSIHGYSEMAKHLLTDISLLPEVEKASWVRTYAINPDDVLDLDKVGTKNELADNVDSVRWLDIKELEKYISILRDAYMGKFGRVGKFETFFESKKSPTGYWIYYSTLRRLGFKDWQWREAPL